MNFQGSSKELAATKPFHLSTHRVLPSAEEMIADMIGLSVSVDCSSAGWQPHADE